MLYKQNSVIQLLLIFGTEQLREVFGCQLHTFPVQKMKLLTTSHAIFMTTQNGL